MYSISGKTDFGRLYENCVFLELKRRLKENEEINFWKNKEGVEADFIIRKGLKVAEIIQVCYDIEDEKTKNREITGLIKCAEEFKLKKGMIITKDYKDQKTLLKIIKIKRLLKELKLSLFLFWNGCWRGELGGWRGKKSIK